MAGLALLALVALVLLAPSGAAEAQTPGTACSGAPASGTEKIFNVTRGNGPQPFVVPADVSRVTISAEGGHGGEYDHTNTGGPGGGLQATFAVKANDCFLVYVGTYGYHSGGAGFAKGGDHGTVPGDAFSSGSSGAGGGGASAVVKGSAPIIVAGGGGGGGGDGDSPGGRGGGGGLSPSNGEQRGSNGGRGGRGGGERLGKGGTGSSAGGTADDYGAGGGGGGGHRGGGGGGTGEDDPAGGGGGGGGGGGSSYVTGQIGQALPYTSTGTCVYKHFSSGCHGQVTIRWTYDQQNLVGPIEPIRPIIRVLPYSLKPVSLPVVLTPAAPPAPPATPASPAAPSPVTVRLVLFHRHRGKWRRAGSLTAVAVPTGDTRLEVPVPKRVRKRLRKHAHGRIRIEAFNEATGARIDRDELRFD